MAIVFSKDLPADELLNSHNNNVVKFNSSNALVATKCKLEVLGVATFEITPDPDGNFTYNFKDLVKALINTNNFKDPITPDIFNNGYVYNDSTLYKELSINFKVTLTGGSSESTTKTYQFIKSIKQPVKYANKRKIGKKVSLLLPLKENSARTYYVPYFEGYPLDIPIYSDADREITIRNKTNNLETNFDLTKGVNRVYVSQGSRNLTIEDQLILMSRVNDLEIIIGSEEQFTVILEKIESDCSKYLKWYNNSGSYSCFRFNQIFETSIKTKTISSLDSDFEDIIDSDGGNNITGKIATQTLILQVKRINIHQKKYLDSLFLSPKVELYLENIFDKQQHDSYLSVKVVDKAVKTLNNKRSLFNVELQVKYDVKTMSL